MRDPERGDAFLTCSWLMLWTSHQRNCRRGLTSASIHGNGTVMLSRQRLVDDLVYSSVSFSSTQRDGYQMRIPFNPAVTAAVNPITGANHAGSTFQTDSPYFVHAQNGLSSSDTQGGLDSRTARAKLLFIPSESVDFLLPVAIVITLGGRDQRTRGSHPDDVAQNVSVERCSGIRRRRRAAMRNAPTSALRSVSCRTKRTICE